MRQLTRSEVVAGLVAATLVGGLVRGLPVLRADFPLHDGGLLYTMAGDLRSNGFALPAFTTYNGGQLPFAYPPPAYARLHHQSQYILRPVPQGDSRRCASANARAARGRCRGESARGDQAPDRREIRVARSEQIEAVAEPELAGEPPAPRRL